MFSFSSKGDEIISFAQLGVVMDGLCEEDMLGVRKLSVIEKVRQCGLVPRRCQLLCTEQ